MGQKIKGGGSRKIGQNKQKCESYAALHKREKNRERRVRKHVRKHPGDLVAVAAQKVTWA